jgi:serine/threonine-protein phosphatase PP1 catalytic subunit
MSVSGELLCSFELLKPLDSAALKSHIKKGRNKRNSILNSPVSRKDTPLACASYRVPSAFTLYYDAKTSMHALPLQTLTNLLHSLRHLQPKVFKIDYHQVSVPVGLCNPPLFQSQLQSPPEIDPIFTPPR